MVTKKETATQKKIRALVEYEPTINQTQIAEVMGVTKQWISWNVKRMTGLHRVRLSGNKPCFICGKLVSPANKSGMCAGCKRMSNSYEFICHQCGTVRVEYGTKASTRRANKRFKKNPYDFCDHKCSQRFFIRRYWGMKKLDTKG